MMIELPLVVLIAAAAFALGGVCGFGALAMLQAVRESRAEIGE